MLPTSGDFFVAFLGILLAGGVPVPIYPPARRSQLEEHLQRQAGILANCEAGVLITVPEARAVARLLRAATPSLKHIVSVAELGAGSGATAVAARREDTAFLQYTSGSTGNPKGVMLTHANLLANIRAMGHAIAVRTDRRLRELAAALSRHGTDRRVVRHALLRGAARRHVADRLSWPPRDAGSGRFIATAARCRPAPNFAYELCASASRRRVGSPVSTYRRGAWRSTARSPSARTRSRASPSGSPPMASTRAR